MHINPHTLFFVAAFAAFYLLFTIRQAANHKIDLYDLMMLSSVAIVPLIFVFFPGESDSLSKIIGVAFPFVLMFGLIIFAQFMIIHKIIAKLHKVENINRMIVQELCIVREKCNQSTDSKKADV